jgi:hypothetical protein
MRPSTGTPPRTTTIDCISTTQTSIHILPAKILLLSTYGKRHVRDVPYLDSVECIPEVSLPYRRTALS